MRLTVVLLFAFWQLYSNAVLATTGKDKPVQEEKEELNVLIRSNYLAPAIRKSFEENFNVKIKPVYYSNDDDRNLLLLESDGQGVDVICVDSAAATAYIASGWLAPISDFNLKNLKHIDSRWYQKHTLMEKFVVPYFWKALGIAFHNKRLEQPITHWGTIISPAPALYSRILMPPTAQETVAITLLSLGYSANSTSLDALRQAEQALTKQRPFVLWASDIRYPATGAINENLWVSAIYNGEAFALTRTETPIDFIYPSEGSVMVLDYLAVAEDSKNKQLAATFLDFINEPENAAENARYIGYSSTNKSAIALLPEKMRQSKWLYPAEDIIKKLELLLPLPSSATKKISQIYFHLQ